MSLMIKGETEILYLELRERGGSDGSFSAAVVGFRVPPVFDACPPSVVRKNFLAS